MKYKIADLIKKYPVAVPAIAVLAVALVIVSGRPGDKGAAVDAMKPAPAASAPEEKPLSSFTLRVSGISHSTPVFTIFGVEVYKGRVGVTPRLMTTLDRPARSITHLKNTARTLILSDDARCVYVYDETGKAFSDRILKFNGPDGKPRTIRSMAVDVPENIIALSFLGEPKIALISGKDFLPLSEIPAPFPPDSLFFAGNGGIYFTGDAGTAAEPSRRLCLLAPPYMKTAEIASIPFRDGAISFDRGGGLFRIFSPAANAAFMIDTARGEGTLMRPGLPHCSDDPKTSALFNFANGNFALVRSDLALLTTHGDIASSISFKCDFLKGGTPVVSENDALKYAFIGSSSLPGFALFKKDSAEKIRTSELPGISSLSAACISE